MTNKLDKQTLKNILAQQKQKALESLQLCQEAAKPVMLDQSSVGRLSRMDAMQQQAMAKAALDRAQIEIQRIESTLLRIDSEDYGFCVKCGNEIEWALLQTNPSVLTCMACRSDC